MAAFRQDKSSSLGLTRLIGILCLVQRIYAHEHHGDRIPEGQTISNDPIDTTLWIHIAIQTVTFGVIFPTGMVLGIIRSRWHVPLQACGAVLAIAGYVLGHTHKGRQFEPNVHAAFSNSLMVMLSSQVLLGIYLKLHLDRGIHGRIRRYVVLCHGVVGKALPIASWVQMLFGGITALGFCHADHLGQCLAHFIMGSAFIAYGILLTVVLLVGQLWLRRTRRSQEFFDSAIIAAWGVVNTFTEHRWGGAWVRNDVQHTTMGVVWWCAGLVGMWLSRKRDGSPKRNIIPGMVIILTGYAMSGHPQHLPLSTMVHTVFGYTLMAAGFTRIVEISFVLKDRDTLSDDGSDPNSFQYLPPFLLYASGFLFMGATEEQMKLVSDAGITHVSYILLLYSVAFLLFLFVNLLLHIYAVKSTPATTIKPDSDDPEIITGGRVNGHATIPGGGDPRNRTRIRDAEEFELEGLMSEDEDAEHVEEGERLDRRINGQAANGSIQR
ncbi:MAG: hypothetical protein M1816_003632 [Peltula sp. TS41687]|nr:MAG: hypothetical protein M1816_003632 [Peltula sp. TS41687]